MAENSGMETKWNAEIAFSKTHSLLMPICESSSFPDVYSRVVCHLMKREAYIAPF